MRYKDFISTWEISWAAVSNIRSGGTEKVPCNGGIATLAQDFIVLS
jgi:hypothetical protein